MENNMLEKIEDLKIEEIDFVAGGCQDSNDSFGLNDEAVSCGEAGNPACG
jgi:hypothetical protein